MVWISFAFNGKDVFLLGLPALVAAIVSFIIGWIWYGPLFGKTWMMLMNINEKEINKSKKKGMGKMLLLNFIGTLITASVLAGVISAIGLSSESAGPFGAVLGFWLWLGFLASTTLLGSVLWENKSWKLFALNGAYWLVNLLVMGAIIGAWQ